jgi:hypothetical protein
LPLDRCCKRLAGGFDIRRQQAIVDTASNFERHAKSSRYRECRSLIVFRGLLAKQNAAAACRFEMLPITGVRGSRITLSKTGEYNLNLGRQPSGRNSKEDFGSRQISTPTTPCSFAALRSATDKEDRATNSLKFAAKRPNFRFRRHSGHDRACSWPAPVANDPNRTLDLFQILPEQIDPLAEAPSRRSGCDDVQAARCVPCDANVAQNRPVFALQPEARGCILSAHFF